jgi:O-antigen ligase
MALSVLPESKYHRILFRWCLFALLAFIAAFFFAQTSKQLNNFFYITLCIPALIIAASEKKRLFQHTPFFLLFCLFAVWLSFTGLILGESASNALKELKPIVYILLLSIVVFYAGRKKSNLPLLLLYVLLIASTIAGLLLIANYYEPRKWNLSRRLFGTGAISNPIWLGAVYGLAAMASIVLFLRQHSIWQQALALLLGIVPFAVLLLAQSRGPMVAFALGLAYALTIFRNKRAALFFGFIVIAGLVFLLNIDTVLDGTRLLKGDSYRLGIWNNAMSAIKEAPILGHGISAGTENTIGSRAFDHFHNVYLTVAYHSGIIGLALFAPLFIRPLFFPKTPYNALIKPLLVFGLTYMLFNASRIFTSPKELWLIFWIPLILLWAAEKNRVVASRDR